MYIQRMCSRHAQFFSSIKLHTQLLYVLWLENSCAMAKCKANVKLFCPSTLKMIQAHTFF